jgi:XapX domain-containing protein
MKLYLISLGAGILVGIIYAVLQVRSPAPPIIALIGLLGMLIGEQIVPTAKRFIAGEPITIAWFQSECIPKITGAPQPLAANETAPDTVDNKTLEKS